MSDASRAQRAAGKGRPLLHTKHSDGADTVSDVLAWAARVDLDVIAITDHDTIEGALIAAELVRVRNGSEVIVGEEISSRDGHILGLFLGSGVQPDLTAAGTIAAVHDHGYSQEDLATLTEFIRRLRAAVAVTADGIRRKGS